MTQDTVRRDVQVLVVGGGVAGVAAATAAARSGARTLLVERYGFLGGTATFGIPFLGVFNAGGAKVVGGILDELVDRMVALRGSPGHARGGRWHSGLAAGSFEFALTPFNPEILKYVCQEMLLESGSELLLHSALSGVAVEDGLVVGVTVETKAGQRVLRPAICVDATGDGDLAAAAGAPFQMGDADGRTQNVTLLFNLADVDVERALLALREGVGLRGWEDWHIRVVRHPDVEGEDACLHFAGRCLLPRSGAKARALTFTAVSFRNRQLFMNITRTTEVDATTSESLTRAEIAERRNVVETWQALRDHVPGFERCYITHAAPQVGVRESRRILGDYVLTGEDVVTGRQFADQVVLGAYPIDIHDPRGGSTKFTFIAEGGSYGIPYRCLLPLGVGNLLVTGRCISATHEAVGSVRLTATATALGQAAGVAAGLAVAAGARPREVRARDLRDRLQAQGAIVASAG